FPPYTLPYFTSLSPLASFLAVSDIRVDSVLIYVIKPVMPPDFFPRSIPSYNCWATIIVFLALKLSLRAASCCMDEVVNGLAGFRFRFRLLTLLIVNFLFCIFPLIVFTSCSFLFSCFFLCVCFLLLSFGLVDCFMFCSFFSLMFVYCLFIFLIYYPFGFLYFLFIPTLYNTLYFPLRNTKKTLTVSRAKDAAQ